MTVDTGHDTEPSASASAVVVKPSRWPAAVQCTSIRRDGGRCRRWSIRGGHNCPKHSTPPSRARAARIVEDERARLVGLLPRARQVLAELLENEDPDVRHRAAVQVQKMTPLVSGKPGAQLDVTVAVSPAVQVRARLQELRARMGDAQALEAALVAPESLEDALAVGGSEVVEAELVDDGWT